MRVSFIFGNHTRVFKSWIVERSLGVDKKARSHFPHRTPMAGGREVAELARKKRRTGREKKGNSQRSLPKDTPALAGGARVGTMCELSGEMVWKARRDENSLVVISHTDAIIISDTFVLPKETCNSICNSLRECTR
jgi:hypothetical protein